MYFSSAGKKGVLVHGYGSDGFISTHRRHLKKKTGSVRKAFLFTVTVSTVSSRTGGTCLSCVSASPRKVVIILRLRFDASISNRLHLCIFSVEVRLDCVPVDGRGFLWFQDKPAAFTVVFARSFFFGFRFYRQEISIVGLELGDWTAN